MIVERWRANPILLLALVAMPIAYISLVHAQFTGDDWHFLAVLRHIDSPLDVVTSNMGGSYYYRPAVLLLFWFSFVALGTDPMVHYGINVAIHCWVAFEIFAFARLISGRPNVSAWVAVLFLVLPATAATPLWISDRFDLVATGAMLLSTRLLSMWLWSKTTRNGCLWGAALVALIAFGSKETAFALLPAQLFLMARCRQRPAAARIRAAFVFALIGVFSLSCRYFALDGWTGKVSPPFSVAAIVAGVTLWVECLPIALQTYDGGVALVTLGVMVLGGLVLRRGAVQGDLAASSTQIVAALLLVAFGAVAAQSSVAAIILPKDHTAIATATLRLYYTPLAFTFISVAVVVARLEFAGLYRQIANAAALLAVIVCTYGSARQSLAWATASITEAQQAAASVNGYAAEASVLKNDRLCAVRLPRSDLIGTDIDLRFKATISSSDPRINCVLVTSPAQVSIVTRISACNSANILPLHSTIPDLPPLARSGTCTFHFLAD